MRGGWKFWWNEGREKRSGGILVTQVDRLSGRQEVRDDQAHHDIDQRSSLCWWQESVDEWGKVRRRHSEDARQPLDCELADYRSGLRRQHDRQMLIVSQLDRRAGDRTDEQVFEASRSIDVGQEHSEKMIEFVDPKCLEDDISPTWEHSVQRGSGDVTLPGDVVDRDLRNTPPLAASLHRIEDVDLCWTPRPRQTARLNHPETVRRKPSHCQRGLT